MKKRTHLAAALENLAENGDPTLTTDGEGTDAAALATDEQPALAGEDLAVVEAESDGEAEASSEASELEEATDTLDGELDEASEDTARVAETASAVDQAAENGGLTPEAVHAVEVATEGLLQKYDLTLAHRMPGLESFSDIKGRAAQTKYAAEALGEKAKELGQKVLDGIKALIKWLQDLFAKYLTVAGRLEARANKIKEAASKATNAKEQEVSFGGFLSRAKALAIGGKLPADVAASIEDVVQRAYKSAGLAGEVGRILDKAGAVAKDAGKDAQNTAANAATAEAERLYSDFFEKSGAAVGASKSNINAAKNAGFSLPESDKHLLVTEVLPGNKVIFGSRDEANKGLSRFGISSGENKFDAQKVSTLSIEQINKIADSAIRAAALKKVIGDIESKIVKMSKLVGTVSFKDSQGFGESFKTAVWSIREGIALAGAFHRPAVQLALATASAGLELAAASLKVYGVQAPAADKGGDKGGEAKPAGEEGKKE